jgi:tetratricopeptide (TPR) repeat protein
MWVDSDAITWNVEQAARMERFGDDSLPFWQRAFDLLKRGPLLADEPYAAWVKERRELLDGYTRQCVHALAHLYLTRYGEAGRAEAVLLLRTYWQQHKTDEDALRPLLELLGEQERYQEAEEYYQQCLQSLIELGPSKQEHLPVPDARTRDIREYLRTKHIQRERMRPLDMTMKHSASEIVSTPANRIHESLKAISATQIFTQTDQPMKEHSVSAESYQVLSSSHLYERLARALAVPSALDETAIEELHQVARTYWHLRRHIGYRHVLPGLLGHLEGVIRLLETPQSPMVYRHLRACASEVAQYIGALYFDIQDYISAHSYYEVATQAAEEAENTTLQATSLGRKSSLFIYSGNSHKAVLILEKAQKIAASRSSVTTLAWLAALQAEAYAHVHNKDACLKSLKVSEDLLQHAPCDADQYEIPFDYLRLAGYKGVCFLRLGQPGRALEILKEGENVSATLSFRQQAIILADKADAYEQQGKIEEACDCALQALHIGDQKSYLLLHRLQKVLTNMEPWSNLQAVNNFARQMALELEAKVIHYLPLAAEESAHG